MATLTRRPSAHNMKPENTPPPISPIEMHPRGSAFGNIKVLATLGFFIVCGFVGSQAAGWGRSVSWSSVRVPHVTTYAVAYVTGPKSNVTGVVHFTQTSPTGPVHIQGELKNLDPNAERGFHIHEFGDATDGCMSSGSHYNPFGMTHGAPKDVKRHVGDLGNIQSDGNGVAKLDFSDSIISLAGPFSIVGRSVLVHTGMDDLGRGGNDESLKTGNAGGRAACGVIGYAKKQDASM